MIRLVQAQYFYKGGNKMASYVSLLRFTEKGIANIKEGPSRLDLAEKSFQAFGAELKEFFLVMGTYDAIVIFEGPDDETATKLSMAIGSQGNVRIETLRAFTQDEYRRIISALP